MKICIITEPLAANYGGILQNYALQTILRRNNHDAYTFDVGKYTWIDWMRNICAITFHRLKGNKIKYQKTPIQRRRTEKPLRKFVYSHIRLIQPRQRRLNVKCLKKYEIQTFIVGSDQVWRPKYNHDIEDKFLSFTNGMDVLRIAYAASFGTEMWEFTPKQTDICKELIKNFEGVSVRESSGVNLCKSFLKVNATHVLDPTLLLTQDDYTQLCTNIAQRPPLVFAYILDNSAVKESEIKNFAALHKLPLILIHAETSLSKNDSIENWLSYFRDAEYVITDSFHGTIFSINFKKNFWVYGNPERGNARFTSILESLNLCDRLVSTIPTNDESIDWNNVDSLLSRCRKESYSWLMQKLS